MNLDVVHDSIDRLRSTSGQRWALALLAVGAVGAASLISAFVADDVTDASVAFRVAPIVVAVGLALVAVGLPDSHTALVVLAVLVLQWWVMTDDPTSAWAIPTALCLVGFHELVALLATTPPSAVLAGAVLRRWAGRALVPVAATVAVWGLAVALDGRGAGVAVVLVGLAALAAAGLLIGPDPRDRPVDDR
jgi:hypothetical protein